MAKWIMSLLQDLSKLITVKMPIVLRTGGMATVPGCSNSKLVQHGELSRKLARSKFIEFRRGKVAPVLTRKNLSRLAYHYFANLGCLAVLQPSSLSKSYVRLTLPQMKIRSSHKEPWMMSDEEVLELITKRECIGHLQHGIVSMYESNQLPSNDPIEDRRFVSRLRYDRDALLFGVLDGHGGDSCAHNVSQRLSDYIGTALLPSEVLLGSTMKSYLSSEHFLVLNNPSKFDFREDSVCYGNLRGFFLDLRRIQKRHHSVAQESPTLAHLQESHTHQTMLAEAKEEQVFHTMTALSKAFLRLDDNLNHEALSKGEDEEANELKFKSAMSGACALVVYIKGTELTVANCGDCRAVLGVQSEDGQWTALQLSNDHTAGNPSEVQRILNEHPTEEASTCLRNERLLGRLAPLRAFGDAKFKWSKKKQEKVLTGRGLTPLSDTKEFHTPPYLTAEPEVTSYQLQRSDKFLILATDGLWDMLSNEEAVEFVRDNIKRHNPGYNITYREQQSACVQEQKSPPRDLENCASRLIREALGGDDHVSVSTSLSIPYPDVRMYRDDITVTVVHFDWSNVTSE